MRVKVRDIAVLLQGRVCGDADQAIERIASLASADPETIAFLAHPRYRAQAEASRAGCLLLNDALTDLADERAAAGRASVLVPDAYLAFARLTQWWRAGERGGLDRSVTIVHPSACVDPSAELGAGVHIGPLCVIEAGARIGAGTVLAARVHVGRACVVGMRCLFQPGVVVGADGFGFARDGTQWVKIEQLGGVRIGNDVELGANTCVDRGALDDTVIEDGVKIDNLVQVAHNVHIGAHTAIAGCVGIAGTARIGARCTIGGGAVVLGHLQVADDVHISAASVVTRSLLKAGHYSGFFPIDDNAAWEKNAASLRQLAALRERLRALEREGRAGPTTP